MNKKYPILITGATGFIGSHLTKKLIKKNYEIHIIVRKNSNFFRIKDISNKLIIHYGDINEFKNLVKIIQEITPRGIFHLAASNIASGISASEHELIQTNFQSTIHLLKAVKNMNYDFFVNTGSFLEYGLKNKPICEDDQCEPQEIYALTKLAATLYCKQIAVQEKKPIITLRIFTPYGPFIQQGRLIENIISNAVTNQDINLTNSRVVRDFIYIDDLVSLYIKASQNAKKFNGEIFNAGTGKKTSIGWIVQYVLKHVNSNSKINWNSFPGVSYDSNFWQANMKKTFSSLKWQPKYDIQYGLRTTIAFIKSNLSLKQNAK